MIRLSLPVASSLWVPIVLLQQLLLWWAFQQPLAANVVAAIAATGIATFGLLRRPTTGIAIDPERRRLVVDGRAFEIPADGTVSARPGQRVAVEGPTGGRLVSLPPLSVAHARWLARHLSETLGLWAAVAEDTARTQDVFRPQTTDAFLETVVSLRMKRLPFDVALLAMGAPCWVGIDGGPSWRVLVGILATLWLAACRLRRRRVPSRLAFSADRIEIQFSSWGDRPAVLRAGALLPARIVPGLGAVPTLIVAADGGEPIEIRGPLADLEPIAALVEAVRARAASVPEAVPEPEALRQLRKGLARPEER